MMAGELRPFGCNRAGASASTRPSGRSEAVAPSVSVLWLPSKAAPDAADLDALKLDRRGEFGTHQNSP